MSLRAESKLYVYLYDLDYRIMHTREEKLQAFGRIIDVLDELREKCPWDRKQTNESLRPQTIEEVYELSDAILKGEERELSKELGDVLLHVLFYAKIGEEKKNFDIVDVINFLCDKLIYRHPHVFSSAQVGDAEDVIKQWEMLKTTEKDGNKRVLSGVPDGLPPLLKAYRMQDKARGVGFDWEKNKGTTHGDETLADGFPIVECEFAEGIRQGPFAISLRLL